MRIPSSPNQSLKAIVCCNRATEAARRALKLVPGYFAPVKQHWNIGTDALLRVGFRTRSSFRLDGGDASLVPARHVTMLLSKQRNFSAYQGLLCVFVGVSPKTEHAEARLATNHLV